jgi:hypothetical protein
MYGIEESCLYKEHSYAHFNYYFPGELLEAELLKAVNEYFDNKDKSLAEAILVFHSLDHQTQESIITDIEVAAYSYFFNWDVPFPRRRTEYVKLRVSALLNILQ